MAQWEEIAMENRTIGVAILGLGTVGLGTWKVLNAQKDEMVHKLGATAEVKKILVRNVAKAAAADRTSGA